MWNSLAAAEVTVPLLVPVVSLWLIPRAGSDEEERERDEDDAECGEAQQLEQPPAADVALMRVTGGRVGLPEVGPTHLVTGFGLVSSDTTTVTTASTTKAVMAP